MLRDVLAAAGRRWLHLRQTNGRLRGAGRPYETQQLLRQRGDVAAVALRGRAELLVWPSWPSEHDADTLHVAGVHVAALLNV